MVQMMDKKGVGLIMIILIGLVPVHFALDHSRSPEKLLSSAQKIELSINKIDTLSFSKDDKKAYIALQTKTDSVISYLKGIKSFESLQDNKHFEIRKSILLITKKADALVASKGKAMSKIDDKELASFKSELKEIKEYTEYAPWQVKLMVSLALGFGTMIGWRRIVVTIGEKIGKSHLTYAQGATAELVAASTITASSMFGLPVSTTHVLTSGVAGAMSAQKGKGNLQMKTIKNIAIAWVVTLPVTIILSAILFLLLRMLMG